MHAKYSRLQYTQFLSTYNGEGYWLEEMYFLFICRTHIINKLNLLNKQQSLYIFSQLDYISSSKLNGYFYQLSISLSQQSEEFEIFIISVYFLSLIFVSIAHL